MKVKRLIKELENVKSKMNTKMKSMIAKINAGLLVMLGTGACAAPVPPIHDWECNYCIEDTRTDELYYANWYALQVDNSICFIDHTQSRHWLPANTYIIYTHPNTDK